MSLDVAMIMRLVDRVTGPHKRIISSVREMGGAVDRAGSGMVERADAMNTAIRNQKAQLAGAAFETAGWAAGLYAVIRPAVGFEASMDKVGAVSRANDADLQRLTESARELGATTPWAASQAAEGMQFLAMAGFDTTQIIATMPGMLNLASAAALGLGETADIASNILTGFKLEAGEMGRVADVLTNTFTSSNVNLTMLGETMAYVGPDAANAGLAIEQTAAMVGLLGNAGIQGSRAGTALRSMLARLAGPTGAAAAALQDLGIQTKDAEGNLRPLPDILAEMDIAMADLGTAAQTELRATIFGLEAATAAGVLMGEAGSGALQTYTDTLYETGSAARVAAEQNDNVMGMLKRAQSVLEAISITIGTVLLPGLMEIGDAILPILERVNEWAAANPELVATLGKLAIGLLVARVAMIGLRFGVLTLIQPFVGLLRWSGLLLRGLGLLAGLNPFGVLALAAVLAWYVIRDNWGDIVDWFRAKIAAVTAAFDEGFVQGLIALLAEFNPFTLFYEAVDGLAGYVGEKLTDLWGRIDGALSGMPKYEAGKLMVQNIWDGAKQLVGPMVADLNASIDGGLQQASLLDTGKALLGSLAGGMGKVIGAHIEAIGQKIREAFGGLSLVEAGRNLIRSLWRGAGELIGQMVADLRDRVEGILPGWAARLISGDDAPEVTPTRAPLTTADVQPTSNVVTTTVGEIHVHPAPGTDPDAVARAVRTELSKAGGQSASQNLYDHGEDDLWP
ncbi:phage tail tape measure protein [Fluviibacterium sp. DFM31]|uniref:Phage tail tape measure protein n=1 Tax=Meridianimarinicoccus marinus TaxID=3231483 RepID=A0ABV3L6V7_9RHOB